MTNEDEIRKSAHARWEAEGRPDGQHDRHWSEAEKAFGDKASSPQTWSGDHHAGVSPPTSTGSVEDEQVEEPANDWPAADPPAADGNNTIPSPVEDFDPPKDDRRTFGNGDTDRSA
jgi:hypothetical protein